jgi:hypothetical protein
MSDFGVVLFGTTSAALRAERILGKTALRVKLIPVPRELSSDCGIALRFDWDLAARVQTELREAGVEPSGLHRLDPIEASVPRA